MNSRVEIISENRVKIKGFCPALFYGAVKYLVLSLVFLSFLLYQAVKNDIVFSYKIVLILAVLLLLIALLIYSQLKLLFRKFDIEIAGDSVSVGQKKYTKEELHSIVVKVGSAGSLGIADSYVVYLTFANSRVKDMPLMKAAAKHEAENSAKVIAKFLNVGYRQEVI